MIPSKQVDVTLQLCLIPNTMEREKLKGKRKPKDQLLFPDLPPEEMKQKRDQVLQKILAEFDLEETMRKYRNLNACTIRLTGNSLADYQFRSELHRMMGTEEIRLSDREWSHRFTKRLRENYMFCLDEKEKRLVRNERKRLHRLRLAGILVDTVSVDPSASGAVRPGAPDKDKAAVRKTTVEKLKKEKGDVSCFQDAESIKKEKELFRRIHRRTYAAPKKLPGLEYLLIVEPTMDSLDSPELLQMKLSSQKSSGMSTSTELARRKKKRLPPNVAQLYERQSVKSLYALARRLLPPMPKPPDPEPVKADKPTKSSGPSAFKLRR